MSAFEGISVVGDASSSNSQDAGPVLNSSSSSGDNMLRQRASAVDKFDKEPKPSSRSSQDPETPERKQKKRSSSWLRRLAASGGSSSTPVDDKDEVLKLFMDFVGLPLLILASVAIVFVLVHVQTLPRP
jgi:hypothetical protein